MLIQSLDLDDCCFAAGGTQLKNLINGLWGTFVLFFYDFSPYKKKKKKPRNLYLLLLRPSSPRSFLAEEMERCSPPL